LEAENWYMTSSDSGKPSSTPGTPETAHLPSSQTNPALGREGAYPVQAVFPGSPVLMDYHSALMAPGYGNGFPPVGAYPSSEPGKPLDPITLLMALRRRWFLALVLGLLSAGVAAGTTWSLWPPSNGSAIASLFVNSEKPYIYNPGPASDFNTYRKSQQVLVRSRAVLEKALERPGVADLKMVQRMGKEATVTYLETSLLADYIHGPEILSLILSGKPEDQAELPILLNAVMDAYLFDIVHIQHNTQLNRLQKLQEYYDELARDINGKNETLVALSKALGTHDVHLIQIQHNFAERQLNRAEEERANYADRCRQKEVDLEIRKGKLKQLAEIPIATDEVEAILKKDAEINRLTQAIGETTEIMETTLKVVQGGKDSSAYKKVKQELDDLWSELEKRREEVRPDAMEEIRQARQGQLNAEIQALEDEILILQTSEKTMKKMVDLFIEKTRLHVEGSTEMDNLQTQIASIQAEANGLTNEIKGIHVEMRAADRVTRLDDPYYAPPTIPKKQLMATLGAGVGAFSVILFGVSWWEFRGRRINTLDEIVHGLGMKVVGALPALPDRRARALPSRDPFYPNYLIESVDTTRTMLLHAARKDQLQSVMVTSARPGEGKTSLSIQLAASLARAGRKTLFLDGDLRNPAANRLFNLPLGPGLSELVRGEVEIAATIQPTSVRNLWMIPAGRWTAQTTEALAQEALRPLLAQLKTEFDFVVVDSSPVLAVVDGLLLSQQVDATIFSILNDVSHAPSVYAAYQRLESLGVRILGAVVNGMTANQFAYKLDYGYGNPASGGADYPTTTAETP
jgi:capsular exopolysaccharide synthesis family protein